MERFFSKKEIETRKEATEDQIAIEIFEEIKTEKGEDLSSSKSPFTLIDLIIEKKIIEKGILFKKKEISNKIRGLIVNFLYKEETKKNIKTSGKKKEGMEFVRNDSEKKGIPNWIKLNKKAGKWMNETSSQDD